MTTAQQILGIRIRAQTIRENAVEMVKDDTERKLQQAQKSFDRVARKHSVYGTENQAHIGETYQLFMRHYPQGRDALREAFGTSRMTRRLAWALCYHGREEDVTIARSRPHLQAALNVIDHQWRWHSLFGVFDALLRTWDDGSSRHLFQEFLSKKLDRYEGSRPRLVHLKEHQIAFLRSDSPSRVAMMDLLRKNRPITDVWELLRLPDHTHGYPYASEVVGAYTRSTMRSASYREYIRPILRFLSDHGRSEAYKRCLSTIILRLDRDRPVDERENVLQIAFRKIGDPARAPEWQPWSGATSSEKEELRDARQALNNWIAQRFITAFFDKVAMDEDRRSFWLQYAPHVTRFKVFGDYSTRRQLKSDDRIRRYVDQRFDSIGGSMSALLMQIEDRIIVEFGKVGGACYIHRKGAPDCPSFDQHYDHIRELRIGTDFPLLMRYTGNTYRNIKGQGRFPHKHDWERRLHWWMRRTLGIEV